jgi:aminotransferase/cystathionine beta-lyase
MLTQFAKQHQLIICSDEIHADLILDEGVQHHPIGSISQAAQEYSFSLMSLNKTFNFPGLGLAWIICPNPQIRARLLKDMHTLIPNPNLLAYEVTQAAIQEGGSWHQALIKYLRSNRDYVSQRINAMPGLSMAHLQATYLAWIDASERHWENPFNTILEAGVAVSPGSQFGDQQFFRLNFGTQRKLLETALDRIEIACFK